MSKKQINTKHEKAILDVITNSSIRCFKDIFVFYKGCTRSTAYGHNLDKLDSIKEAIEDNRRTSVNTMLDKWEKSDNATLQIAAMRIICDESERQKLNQQYIDHSTKGDKITKVTFTD